MKLSDKQQEIVNFCDGPILVQAGPGSGKTRVLIERIKHLLKTKKRCKILALTFSNLAADEMKIRLQEDYEVAELVENVNVGTIHSFCLDLVQKRGSLIGLFQDMTIFENSSDQIAILKDVFINDQHLYNILSQKEKQNEYLRNILQEISDKKKNFIEPELCADNELFSRVYKEYNQRLLMQNALDFDDILFYAYKILTENPSVVKLYTSFYKYICVDEAQDLNFAQYNVIKALCGKEFKNIMLVGDSNQSIYAFNGSDSKLMTNNFVKDFSPCKFELNENFRSAKAIVRFADKLENYNSVSNYVYEGELKVNSYLDENSEAEAVANTIENLIQNGHKDIEGQITYDSFAIIARNKYVFKALEEKFKELKIPFYYKKTLSGIDNESDFMKVFDLITRVLLNSKDIIHMRELIKLVSNSSQQYFEENADGVLNNILQNTVYSEFINYFEELKKEPLALNKVLDNILDNITNNCDDDEKYLIINDLDQWKQHWKKYTAQVYSENRKLLSFRNFLSLGKTQDVSTESGVSFLTAHMSKGLQFDAVFVVGLSEGTFPDYRAIRKGGTDLEQEKNNMYVAVTRAKRLCYLSYPQRKKMPWGDVKWQEPSRYILEELRMNK